jgi:predicted N-formylglutamate amidohydrolase
VVATALSLLAEDEPPPVRLHNADGRGAIVLVCEHAGRRIPRALGALGLAETDVTRHIAWDIGAAGLAAALAERLDAPLFTQTYSRLVCDCNRRTDVPAFIPEVGEATPIPGNVGLDEAGRRARTAAIWQPFHDAIEQALDGWSRAGRKVAFVTVHSFTPVFLGRARPMQAGLLFNRDPRLARLVGARLRAAGDILVTDNEPYFMDDVNDYTVPHHGERRGLPCLEIEVRNDLIAEPAGQLAWADRLAPILRAAVSELETSA